MTIRGAALSAGLALALLPGECLADYWYCQFTPFRNQKLSYFSDAFGPTENIARRDGGTVQKIRLAFADFVAVKYSETGNATCAYFPDQTAALAELKRSEDLLTNTVNNGKSVATGWRYTGAP